MGILTVGLVVLMTAILQAAIATSPAIFLVLAENQTGEEDITLTAEVSQTKALPTLNYTSIASAFNARPESGIRGAAPRWPFLAAIAATEQPAVSTSSYVLALDSAVEESIGLGRRWGKRALGPAECYVSTSALDEIGV